MFEGPWPAVGASHLVIITLAGSPREESGWVNLHHTNPQAQHKLEDGCTRWIAGSHHHGKLVFLR